MSEKFASTIFVNSPSEIRGSRPVDNTGAFAIIVENFSDTYTEPATITFTEIDNEPGYDALTSEVEQAVTKDSDELDARQQDFVDRQQLFADLTAEPSALPDLIIKPTLGEAIKARKNALICAAMATCALTLTGVTTMHIEKTGETAQTSHDTRHSDTSRAAWLNIQDMPSAQTVETQPVFIPVPPAPAAEVIQTVEGEPDADPATYELVGADNIQKAFNYLVDIKHMPEDQAAALVANWEVECPDLIPGLVEGFKMSKTIPIKGGYGLSQLTLKSRKEAFRQYLLGQPAPYNAPDNFITQMNFALVELNGTHQKALDDMNNQVVLDKKHPHSLAYNNAVILLTEFEMPFEHAVDGNNAIKRGANADQIMATKHLWRNKTYLSQLRQEQARQPQI